MPKSSFRPRPPSDPARYAAGLKGDVAITKASMLVKANSNNILKSIDYVDIIQCISSVNSTQLKLCSV